MPKKKETRGGKRPGAGRPIANTEKTSTHAIQLTSSQKATALKYGPTVNKAIQSILNNI